MPTAPAFLMAWMAFLGPFLHAAEVVPDPFPPAKITTLYIVLSAGDMTITVQSAGDAVTYRKQVGDKMVENSVVHPSDDDWFQFIQGLNKAKVYAWAPNYEYPGQGLTWVIHFQMNDRIFNSQGANEYPKEGDEALPAADPKAGASVPFNFFLQAVQQLVGKAPAPLVPPASAPVPTPAPAPSAGM